MFNASRVQKNLNSLRDFLKGNVDAIQGYTGWGGLREAIYTPHIYYQLKEFLSDSDIVSLKRTLTNAYYTPIPLVNGVWSSLQRHLSNSVSSILEPSLGTGVFIDRLPKAFEAAQITGVEIDSITAKMAAARFPKLTVHALPFEAYHPEKQFDLIVGNPPYGRDCVQDARHPDISRFRIHNFFIAKCIRLLADSGLLGMVVPSFFLDSVKNHGVRSLIAKEGGELIAAYRFPDNLFANAKVTVDIIVLQKKVKADKSWCRVKPMPVDGKYDTVNTYFHQHPEHILGKLRMVPMYGREGITCRTAGNPYRLLNNLLQG